MKLSSIGSDHALVAKKTVTELLPTRSLVRAISAYFIAPDFE